MCARVCVCVRHGAREFSNYSEADDFFFFLCVGCSVRPVGVWILGGGVLSERKSIIRTPRLGQREAKKKKAAGDLCATTSIMVNAIMTVSFASFCLPHVCIPLRASADKGLCNCD